MFPFTSSSTPFDIVKLLPASITRLPILTLPVRVTADGVALPLLMQTFVVAALGTLPVLQFVAVFQLPEAPPVQIAAPEATQAVVAVKLNWAPTLWFAFITTTHDPVPVQLPLHPTKTDPAFGAAVSVTVVPWLKLAEQVGWHVMPDGVLDT